MKTTTLRDAIEEDKEAIKEILGLAKTKSDQILYPKVGNTLFINTDTEDFMSTEPKYTKEEWIERTKKEAEANQKHQLLSDAGVKLGTVIRLAGEDLTLIGYDFNEETLEYDYKVLRKYDYALEERSIPFNYFIAAGVFNKEEEEVNKEDVVQKENGTSSETNSENVPA